MKRTLFLLVFAFAVQLLVAQPDVRGNEQTVPLKKLSLGHLNLPDPADQPDVYYDAVNQEIIIDGTGEVTYYDVEIASVSTWTVVISTQVSGYYDTIDVSSLPTGEYCITIDSPRATPSRGSSTPIKTDFIH